MTSQGTEGLGMNGEGSLTRYARELYAPDAARREEAARQIWLRFSERLAAEVRRRLNPQILRRAGTDDVVQSLFASFFAAAPGPGGPPSNRAQLWRLLVHFTICKVAKTAHHHQAKRRNVHREKLLTDIEAGTESRGNRGFEPEDFRTLSPEDEVIAREEFARLLAVLPDDLQRVFVMRLEGYTNAQIAAQIGRVERTVELKLRTIRGLLRPYLKSVSPPASDEPTSF